MPVRTYLKSFFRTLRTIPSTAVSLFTVSVIVMNLLANKTIYQSGIIAVDGGFVVSWMAFLSMDMITKGFGARAATRISVFALAVNLFVSLIFALVALIPTAEDFSAFNGIFGGTWFIVVSSSAAFLLSAVVNNALNAWIGRQFKKNPDGRLAYYTRSYVSTFIGQFVDNLTFAYLTFTVFAPIYWGGYAWTYTQCITCSLVGALMELLMEVIFSPIGYRVTKRWAKEGIGLSAEGEQIT